MPTDDLDEAQRLARLRVLAEAAGLDLPDDRLRAMAPLAEALLSRFGQYTALDLGDTHPARRLAYPEGLTMGSEPYDLTIRQAGDALRRRLPHLGLLSPTPSSLASSRPSPPSAPTSPSRPASPARAPPPPTMSSRAGRDRGPLHGIPLALKDVIDTAGITTTAGSDFLRDRVPEVDAAVVTRLKEAARC